MLTPEKVYPPNIAARLNILDNGCWDWTGSLDTKGYAMIANPDNTARAMRGHRYGYIQISGAIDEDLVLDHLCHTNADHCDLRGDCPHRRCMNPDHVEAVTQGENLMRSEYTWAYINSHKTHCIWGHEFTASNTKNILGANGNWHRACKTCAAARRAAWNNTPILCECGATISQQMNVARHRATAKHRDLAFRLASHL